MLNAALPATIRPRIHHSSMLRRAQPLTLLVLLLSILPFGSALADLPPLGAIYTKSIVLPVLGDQTVELAIRDASTAVLRLAGALTLHEALQYGSREGSGELYFILGERTRKLLGRLGVTLRSAEYTPDTDSATVVVAPPLVPAVRICLGRGHQCQGRGDLLDVQE
eukprot:CAMPEP_0206032670 /NCGR_PEP_ID=MMETSP1466-20131121/100_1 /ASSEMBLY_ACC=CAM_ASM_001126 /TAXON_ID=44452 /ORGANISM="Pavlova gyrans, Strain CCMP608" /LENGTH=165 /DNA_ID=CAMNT_0053406805 /DNA_START=19 /DNA_END=516 /DNA_ORIENTATION=+